MAEEEGEMIGKVIHFFPHPVVAVVVLDHDLKIGDSVKFVGPETGFTQTVESMQVEHEPVEEAKSGTEVAIKVKQAVKRNWRIHRLG